MDLVAGALELFGAWLVGSRRRVAFLAIGAGNAVWIWVAFDRGVFGLLLVCVPGLVIAARNWRKWS